MTTYIIRQAPVDDYSDPTGLGKYGRSRMPGCRDTFQAAIDPSGKFITGLTEEETAAFSNSIYDYGNTSDFWKTFNVVISSDNDKLLSSEVPIEYISYKMLIANGYVAPSKEALSDYRYKDAMYYVHVQEDEDAKELSSHKKKDKARALLLGIDDNKDKMLLYGQYLEGLKYNNRLGESTIYKMLRSYIDSSVGNAINFIELFDKPIEELQTKIIIDKALKRRLIVKNQLSKGNIAYQYGQVTLGGSIEELYKNLANIEFASELKQIKDELDK